MVGRNERENDWLQFLHPFPQVVLGEVPCLEMNSETS